MRGISYLFVFFIYLSFSLGNISGKSLRNRSPQHDEAVKQNLENPCPNIMLDQNNNKYPMIFFAEVDYPCCPCGAGYRRVRPCEKGKPHTTQCVPCENGTFMDEAGHGHSTCKKESITCPEDQMFIPSTATTKPYCMCIHGYKVDKDDECQLHTECKPGFGVDVDGNPFRDTECIKCQYGFEKPGFSSTARCKPTKKVINHPKNQHLTASVDLQSDSVHNEKQPRADSFHSTRSITQATTLMMTVQEFTDNTHGLILGMKPFISAIVIPIVAMFLIALAIGAYFKRKKSLEPEKTPPVEFVQFVPSNGTRRDEGEELHPENRSQNNFNEGNSSAPNTSNTNEPEGNESPTHAARSENDPLLCGSASTLEASSPRSSTRPSIKSNTPKSDMSWCQKRNSKKKNISSMSTLSINSKLSSGSIENCSSSQVDNNIRTNRHSYSDGIKVPLVNAEPFTCLASSQQLSTSKLSPLNSKSKSMSVCDQAFSSSQEESTKTHLFSYTGGEKPHPTEALPFMSQTTTTSVPQIPPSSPHPLTATQTTVLRHNTSSTATRSSSTFPFSGHRANVMQEIKKRLSKLVRREQVREFFRDIRNHPTTPQTLEDWERIHRSTSEMFIAAFEKLMDLGSHRFNPQVLHDYFVSQENQQLAEIVQDFFEEYYRHESN